MMLFLVVKHGLVFNIIIDTGKVLEESRISTIMAKSWSPSRSSHVPRHIKKVMSTDHNSPHRVSHSPSRRETSGLTPTLHTTLRRETSGPTPRSHPTPRPHQPRGRGRGLRPIPSAIISLSPRSERVPNPAGGVFR